MDELTYSRNRRGVRKVGRLYAGGRFCDRKVCATLMASTIARSELMRKNAPGTLAFQLDILPTRFPVQMPALAREGADGQASNRLSAGVGELLRPPPRCACRGR